MSALALIFLYAAFRVKHFACDFLLQTDWMALTKGKPGKEGWQALFSHAGIHALGTLVVVMMFAPSFWWLAPVDFVAHAAIDRIKGSLTYRRHWDPGQTIFWWSFGLDQEAHNITHLIYIIMIASSLGVAGLL